jgi:hypothetical protein
LIDLDNGDYGRPVTRDAAGLSFKKMKGKRYVRICIKRTTKGYFCWAGGKLYF